MADIEKLKVLNGVTEDAEETVTIADLVEAIDILTNIVLGGDE